MSFAGAALDARHVSVRYARGNTCACPHRCATYSAYRFSGGQVVQGLSSRNLSQMCESGVEAAHAREEKHTRLPAKLRPLQSMAKRGGVTLGSVSVTSRCPRLRGGPPEGPCLLHLPVLLTHRVMPLPNQVSYCAK